ncbi:DNA-binding transcriptional LysR family regulator [Amaricoccus macauensis]|uniref:DNA-binding transcriptional LysR family regulator n=1 Tax=Amaricoccus macauensis TaxID=57001 RepID=A0A840SUR0_9RHOB|nr:LysR substrate-binding domain-containing protein [Amaricoccus macauensis]MBB5224245.1 DNA-binding transcriptional LysR family regulator [Amaricoccus macauensis]
MSQVPLGGLRFFEAVARHGSFSRAADELCVTQSAVSHQVRGLEDWFGAPLFERTGNRATLRPHGAELAESLARAFGEIDGACRRARRAGGPPELAVAVIPSVAICWLIPRLGDFRALVPGVAVRILYAIHGQPIDFRDVDLAVVFAERPPRPPGMAVTRFLPGRTVPVAAPHLGRPETPEAMLAAGLLHDTDASGWRAWLDAAGAADVEVAPGPMFEDFNLLRAAALAGQGVALCPLAIVAEDLREGRLAQLSGVTVREDCGYYLISAAAPPADRAPAIAAFRDWLLATAEAVGETPSLPPRHSSRGLR